MELFTSEEIENIFKNKFKKKLFFNEIKINSRLKSNNSLFIPIKGKKFDGHDFIHEAFKNGATASLVNYDYYKKYLNKTEFDDFLIPVKDTLKSLQLLAKYSRMRSKLKKMICITGSNGKTTLKDWLNEVLKNYYITYATQGNFNNQIGLPLSLSRMPKNTEVCILEIGTNQPGEIEFLTSISSPDISIVTNIGDAHIGNFKNRKNIAIEKSKIFSSLEKGLAIIPYDNFYQVLINEAKKNKNRILSFGDSNKSDASILNISSNPCESNYKVELEILGKKIKFDWNYFGVHWVTNILIILIIAKELNLLFNDVLKQILKLKPEVGRGSLHKTKINGKDIVIIDDSYNANPNSMKNSLLNFLNLKIKNQRKICVLGDMLELGKKKEFYHKEISLLLNESDIDFVITVGKESKIISENLTHSIKSKHFPDIKRLNNFLNKNLIKNDLVLFKGSNSVKLWEICKILTCGS